MIKAGTLAIFLALLVVSGWAQDHKLGSSTKPKASTGADPSSPVTSGEVNMVFTKMEKALQSVIHLKAVPKLKQPAAPNAPATRSEIVEDINQLFEMARPKFKFTPRMISYNSKVLTIPANDHARPLLEKLIKWGCIAKLGPLATSAKPGLSLQECGDAIGLLVNRISDLTHTPSSKWSPYMQSRPEKRGGG